ncbi:MAG: hypothetical protein SH817_09930 [Leptospira sp.]|nr:hypothetical protein [Leptospira sp.]
MDTQHYVKLKDIVSPLTGTILTKETTPQELSTEKSILNVKRREIEAVEGQIDKWLVDHIEAAIERGDAKFMNFWNIQKGTPRFNEELFTNNATMKEQMEYQEAKDKIRSLTEKDEYMKVSKSSIRYPKF